MAVSLPLLSRRRLEFQANRADRKLTHLTTLDSSNFSDSLHLLIDQFLHGTSSEHLQSLQYLRIICHCTDHTIESLLNASGLFNLLLDFYLSSSGLDSAPYLDCLCGLLCYSTSYHDPDILALIVTALPLSPPLSPSHLEVEMLVHVILSLRAFFVRPSFHDFFFDNGILPRLLQFYQLDPAIDSALMLIAADCGEAQLTHEHAVNFVSTSMDLVADHTAEWVALLVYWQVSHKPSRFNCESIQRFTLNLFRNFPSSRQLIIECSRYVDERRVTFFTDEVVSQTICEAVLNDRDVLETASALRALSRFVQIGALKAEWSIFKGNDQMLPRLFDLIFEGPFILKTRTIKLCSLILQNLPSLFDTFLISPTYGPQLLSKLFLAGCECGSEKAIQYILIGIERYGNHADLEELTEPFLLAISTPECVNVIKELMDDENEDVRILADGLYQDRFTELFED
jgi:hypothetical protein